jgi:hypothetical protein
VQVLVQTPQSRFDLLTRTRQRNSTIWTQLNWGGIMAPINRELDLINTLHAPMIELFITETEELFSLKEYQRDKQNELGQRELAQDQQLVDEKMAAEREVLAIKLTVEEYVQAARLFDAQARAIVQTAKEYAAAIEREQIGLERSKAELAVAKEGMRLKQISAEIYQEYLNRAMVEADLAKAQLEVLKAHTRVIMAGIEERKAEIQLVEAELQEAMAIAERATLQADIAMILAEIIVKKLAETKLAVETAEIEAGFRYIQTKLDDLLSLWTVRTDTELLRAASESKLQEEVIALLNAEERERDLQITAAEADRGVFNWEVTETNQELVKEQELSNRRVAEREEVMDTRHRSEMRILARNTWAKLLINAAQRWVHKNHVRKETSGHDMRMFISKG